MADDTTQAKGFLGKLLSLPNDNPQKTLFIAVLMCLICSVLVSTAAVSLKSYQQINQKNDIRQNILAVSGLSYDKSNVNELFSRFEIKLVDLDSGTYSETDLDPASYDQKKAAGDSSMGIKLSSEQDIASIGRRAKLAPVYLLKENGQLKQVVLPVHGYGLWSTLYGFISLDADFNTIKGLRFYSHAETPGLGGEVDNPKWRALWDGKKVFNNSGEVGIHVIRGHVSPNTQDAEYKVDGLSGATLTSKGVTNLVQFWMGEHGFGPYLKNQQSELGK
jgi:Na+-transporting NADH:ubiquinone oxidoreductase subunit C